MCRDGVSCQLILTIHSFNRSFCSFFVAAVNKYIVNRHAPVVNKLV